MGEKIHLIAVCGTGMGSLAALLVEAGHEVRGSDANVYPPMSDLLREAGVVLMEGFRPENLAWGPDRVIIGNAVRRVNPEAEAAEWLQEFDGIKVHLEDTVEIEFSGK